jgi:hypothetical protein
MESVFRIVAFFLFVCLSALVVYIVLRSGSAGRARRRSESFRTSITAIRAGAESALAPVSTEVDAVRRGLRAGRSIVPDLTAARASLETLIAQAESLPAPEGVDGGGALVAGDLRRACAAIDAVLAGCVDASESTSRAVGLAAQTSVKRGYVEMQHAREALARHVADAVHAAGDGRR